MNSPPPIDDLWAQPAPTHAVVLGKGPSLDRYDPDEYETWIKFAVNEAVLAEPMGKPVNARYLMFNDGQMRALEKIAELDVIPIRGYGHLTPRYKNLGYWFEPGVMAAKAGGGSAPRMLVILGEWATRHLAQPMEVLLVGFDAWDKPQGWTNETMYAKCIPQIVGQRGKNYAGIVKKLQEVAFAYRHKLVVRLFHRELEAQEYAATIEP